MKLAVTYTRAQTGISAPVVTVEVNLARGLPCFSIVGLAETAVKESRDRVRGAVENSHFEMPDYRITASLAPADLPKEGSRFDLAIAVALLAASGQIPATRLKQFEFLGELTLAGQLREIRGALASAIQARDEQRTLVLPWKDAVEAAQLGLNHVLGANTLLEVCAFLRGEGELPTPPRPSRSEPATGYADFADVAAHHVAKRALEIAAAGGHNILMIGPPGTGKTMLASRLPGILPPMTDDEAMETAAIYSVTSSGFSFEHWRSRAFRAPHHSASAVALVGGGNPPRPGEISLAHNGVLFLDELPEFQRRVLETLREPLESGYIMISRASRQAQFPARFQLVAAMNPCPCGFLGDLSERCRCSDDQIKKYRGRISGPLLDRVDMHVEVPRLPPQLLIRKSRGETSAAIRERVIKAHRTQLARQNQQNSRLGQAQIEQHCLLTKDVAHRFEQAIAKLALSGRAYHRVLKLARTIADLEDSEKVETDHLNEAIGLRRLDRVTGN